MESTKGRKEIEYYFEGEKRQKKGEYVLLFQAKGKDPVGKGILKIKKERWYYDNVANVIGRNGILKPH